MPFSISEEKNCTIFERKEGGFEEPNTFCLPHNMLVQHFFSHLLNMHNNPPMIGRMQANYAISFFCKLSEEKKNLVNNALEIIEKNPTLKSEDIENSPLVLTLKKDSEFKDAIEKACLSLSSLSNKTKRSSSPFWENYNNIVKYNTANPAVIRIIEDEQSVDDKFLFHRQQKSP